MKINKNIKNNLKLKIRNHNGHLGIETPNLTTFREIEKNVKKVACSYGYTLMLKGFSFFKIFFYFIFYIFYFSFFFLKKKQKMENFIFQETLI